RPGGKPAAPRPPIPNPSVVLLLTLVGLALRLHDLGVQSLWYDEGVSAVMARRALAPIPAAALCDVPPPPYYLFLPVLAAATDPSEWSLRLFSAFAGTLTIPLVWRIGARASSAPVGLAAAALFTLTPLPVYYSQEARMYALAMLLVAGAAAAALEASRSA